MSPQKSSPTSLHEAAQSAKRHETIRCVCGEELVQIDLLIDGEELTMNSCSRCDARSWHRKGERVQLGGVLTDLSATQTRYRRRESATQGGNRRGG